MLCENVRTKLCLTDLNNIETEKLRLSYLDRRDETSKFLSLD